MVELAQQKRTMDWQRSQRGRSGNRSLRSSVRSRFAFTLVELAVVMTIVAILISLSTVGIQAARAVARRMQCQNNLRQQGQAIIAFEATYRFVPGNGGPIDGNVVRPAHEGIQPGMLQYPNERWRAWGIGDPSYPVDKQPGPWSYSILPYVEQSALFEEPVYDAVLSFYRCPDRPRDPPATPGEDFYGKYIGGNHRYAKFDYAGNSNVFKNLPDRMKLADINDGLSQTVFVAEKAHNPLVQVAESWYFDEPPWIGGSHGTARDGIDIFRDATDIGVGDFWGSAHAVGIHAVFGDGHVELVSYDVDKDVWPAMLTTSGRDHH